MKIRMTFDFDDDQLADIAAYHHFRYGDAKRARATRKQAKQFIEIAMDNAWINVQDMDDSAGDEIAEDDD